MKILLTNDDSIHAPGFTVLEEIARQLSDDVWCVAPEMDRSSLAHSITELDPIRLKHYSETRYSVRGTPADCVTLALRELLPAPPDLILSGVNSGVNRGNDVLYSGTLGAAMEGALFGICAIGLSQNYTLVDNERTFNWDISRHNAADLIKTVLTLPQKHGVFYGINFPDCRQEQLQAPRVVAQYVHPHGYEVEKRLDGRLQPYYWIKASKRADTTYPEGTDARAIAENAPTVTAFNVNMTDVGVTDQLHVALQSSSK